MQVFFVLNVLQVEGVYPIGPKPPAVGGSEGVAQVLATGKKVSAVATGDWVLPARPGLGSSHTSYQLLTESNQERGGLMLCGQQMIYKKSRKTLSQN